jgi:Ca2+-binding EF-hand superfamily protein
MRKKTQENGTIPLQTLKSLLLNVGEKFTEEEINSTFIKYKYYILFYSLSLGI